MAHGARYFGCCPLNSSELHPRCILFASNQKRCFQIEPNVSIVELLASPCSFHPRHFSYRLQRNKHFSTAACCLRASACAATITIIQRAARDSAVVAARALLFHLASIKHCRCCFGRRSLKNPCPARPRLLQNAVTPRVTSHVLHQQVNREREVRGCSITWPE